MERGTGVRAVAALTALPAAKGSTRRAARSSSGQHATVVLVDDHLISNQALGGDGGAGGMGGYGGTGGNGGFGGNGGNGGGGGAGGAAQGGAVYVSPTAVLRITGGSFSANDAVGGDGGAAARADPAVVAEASEMAVRRAWVPTAATAATGATAEPAGPGLAERSTTSAR